MSVSIPLTVYLFCLMESMFNNAIGGKSSDLENYYIAATYHVQYAAYQALHNLSKAAVKGSEKALLSAVQVTLDNLNVDYWAKVEYIDICRNFNLYKRAFVIMHQVLGLKEPFAHVLADWRTSLVFDLMDRVYKTWMSTCPQYQSNQKISLFYVNDEQYLSHDRNPMVVCCERERSVGDWERNFFLRPYSGSKVVQYGDVVGVGYKEGRFLSNEGSRMNWYKTRMDSWERWKVETYCTEDYESYGVGRDVHFCDLVMFHAVDDGNYFRLLTRTKDRGPYDMAILGSQGTIPFWRKHD